MSNQLIGTLPSQVGQLTALTDILSMAANSLTGKLPTQLGRLPVDFILDLSTNGFSGRPPSELGQLSKLSIVFDLSLNGSSKIIIFGH